VRLGAACRSPAPCCTPVHPKTLLCTTTVQPLSPTNPTAQIRGIKTNIPFLENVLRHPNFLAGAPTTAFIEKYSKELFT
jgi:pyruvate carboxylase